MNTLPHKVQAAVGGFLLVFAFSWSLKATDALCDTSLNPAPQSAQDKTAGPDMQANSKLIGPAAPAEQEADRQNTNRALTENSWDFADPEGVPGFGPLDPADAQLLLLLFDNSAEKPQSNHQHSMAAPDH